MYKIALVCENGASTSMVVRKMKQSAQNQSIDALINAYPYTQLENFIAEYDVVLLGPQLGYKKELTLKEFSQYAAKVEVINSMDFGMMNGEKILREAIELADKNQGDV